MKNKKCLKWEWAGGFAVILAVALITGCQSAKPVSTAANTPAAAAPATQTPPPAAPATAPAQPAAPAAAPTAAPAATPVAAPAATATNAVAVTPPVRIKAGVTESMKDSEGNVWVADEGFADGETYEVDDASITNTTDPALYRTERYSMTAYNFAVPNGKYTVKLHFAEVYENIGGPGDRVFSFNVQGHEFKDFDIWVKAGGFDKAYVESVDVDVTNGTLNITFTPNVENPKINGIEILPRT
jgi:Malectin domain